MRKIPINRGRKKKAEIPVAVQKAKRQGVEKKFYITGPAGLPLAEILPKIDMLSRLFIELFAEQKISIEDYQAQRNSFYERIELIDAWVSDSSELLLRAGLIGNAGSDYIRLYKAGIRQKKTM